MRGPLNTLAGLQISSGQLFENSIAAQLHPLGEIKYYQKKTGLPAKGYVVWGGVQFQNYSSITVYNQLRYGLGGFMKYSNFDVQTSLKKYSLQDATVGVTLEAALQFVFASFGFDLGLHYYWDKNPYGVLSVGVLF